MITKGEVFGREIIRRYDSDTEATECWDWLFDRASYRRYQGDVPPFKAPASEDAARLFLVVEWRGTVLQDASAGVCGLLRTTDGTDVWTAEFHDSATAFSCLAKLALRAKYRGYYLVVTGGARLWFHVFLRLFAPSAVAQGYTLKPVASGTDIKCITIRKDGHSWTLVDPLMMLGTADYHSATSTSISASAALHSTDSLRETWHSLDLAQRWLLRTFATGFRATVGSLAISAAARSLASGDKWFRPLPLAVAMCRDGGALRGGYLWAREYRSQAYHYDLTRAYTWALTQPLPTGLAIGPCISGGVERAGIYLCRVSGSGEIPAYIGAWKGAPTGFRRAYFGRGSTYSVLPSCEFSGLRALGYSVAPGWGVVFCSGATLGAFAERLGCVIAQFGRGDWRSAVAKRIGNSVYGKFAEDPRRTEIVYSEVYPGANWYPYITTDAREVPGLWERESVEYRPHQHIDVAAVVAGSVRSRLYHGVAAAAAIGAGPVAIDTDGFWTQMDASTALGPSSDALGQWRYAPAPDTLSVAGRRFRREGETVKHPGWGLTDPSLVELIMDGQEVVVSGKRLQSPFERQAMYADVKVRLRKEF